MKMTDRQIALQCLADEYWLSLAGNPEIEWQYRQSYHVDEPLDEYDTMQIAWERATESSLHDGLKMVA